jgi:integrase
MAYLFKRPKSPYWWIGYRSGENQVQESTKLRHDDRAGTRRAQILANEKSRAELNTTPSGQRDRWEFWVPGFMALRYKKKQASAERKGLAWKNLSAYLLKNKVCFPAQLTYIHCRDYIAFREKGDREFGVLRGHHNTALYELKFLGMLMREAIKRGYASANPAADLGISKLDPAEKPEIPDADLALIWRELQKEPEWMRNAWQISLYTGCRLRATRLQLARDVDLQRGRITFHEKGGKIFEVPMRRELLPVFQRLIFENRSSAVDMPAMPSKFFYQFFKRIHRPQYCFHCLRVTFITRAARAGLQEREVMRLVNHASTTIHRIYVRLRADDLEAPLRKLDFPILGATPDAPASPL